MLPSPSLYAHHIRVRATAKEPLELNEYSGSALRGALFTALWGRFCVNKEAAACANCPLVQSCPVSSLVAPLRDEATRGRDVPRPYAIRPPIPNGHIHSFHHNDSFEFGLTLFGCRIELFPYVAMSLHTMSERGIGRRLQDNEWQRGRFVVNDVQVHNILTGEAKAVPIGTSTRTVRMQMPDMPITCNDAELFARTLPQEQITLRFLTPMRLIEEHKLLQRPLLRPLIQRLLERHDSLAREYGGIAFDEQTRNELTSVAEKVEILHDETKWTEVRSYSQRQHKGMAISGLKGTVTYRGNLQPLLPLLAWGMVLQIGKGTTKGNGIYRIDRNIL